MVPILDYLLIAFSQPTAIIKVWSINTILHFVILNVVNEREESEEKKCVSVWGCKTVAEKLWGRFRDANFSRGCGTKWAAHVHRRHPLAVTDLTMSRTFWIRFTAVLTTVFLWSWFRLKNRKVHSPSNKDGLKIYPLYLGLLLRASKPTKMQKGENMRSSKLHSSWELTTFTTHWTHFGPQHLLGPLQHPTLKCLLFSVTLFLSHALIREGLVRTFRICLILNPRLLTCTPKPHFTAAFYADKWVYQTWRK